MSESKELLDTSATLRNFDRDELDRVVSFDEAVAASGLVQEMLVYIGSPWTVLKDREKDKLIGVPFMIRSWAFARDEKTDRPYVVARVVTKDNAMYIFTDGSTGILQDLDKVTAERVELNHPSPYENLLVANGLRVSEYDVNEDGKPAKAGEKVVSEGATYYLA